MWAQLITMRLTPGNGTAGPGNQLRAAEQPGPGLVRALVRPDPTDPGQVHALVVFESEDKARAREQDPRRQQRRHAARALMAGIFGGPPEFTGRRVAEERTGGAGDPRRPQRPYPQDLGQIPAPAGPGNSKPGGKNGSHHDRRGPGG
jgi:hypothetical protein